MFWWLLACTSGVLDETDPAPSGPVRFNEVQSHNDSTVVGPDGDTPDWIELINTSDHGVAHSDLQIRTGNAELWTGTDGVLEPGGRLLIWAAGGIAGPRRAPFLLGDSERLTLEVGGAASDRMAIEWLGEDTSLARFPDGGEWAPTGAPTPDAPNGDGPASLDPSDYVFRDDHIVDIAIELPTDAWNALYVDPYTEVEGAVTVDGFRMEGVGVRLKGQSGSFRTLDEKAAFVLDLDEYEPENEYRGLTRMTVNNCVQDQTWTHQQMAFDVFRAMGVASPRSTWARVTVNDELFGLYAWVESVDGRFLERNWSDATGNLYETAYWLDFTPGAEEFFEIEQGSGDTSDIVAVIDILQREPTDPAIAALDQVFDIDNLLRSAAVEATILHWDGLQLPNNVRYYHDPHSGRFFTIPWGVDQTFFDYRYGTYGSNSVLVQFCQANPGCIDRYDALLLEAADTMEGMGLPARMDAYEALLTEEIKADPRKEFTFGDFRADFDHTRAIVVSQPDAIRRDVSER